MYHLANILKVFVALFIRVQCKSRDVHASSNADKSSLESFKLAYTVREQ
jgi:hypothetical protein